MTNFQQRSPDIARSISKPVRLPEEASASLLESEGERKPKVAIFVTHGMGQQVPFETMDSVAEGLMQTASQKNALLSGARARLVQSGDVKTQRLEFDMRDAKGRDVEVHIYEGYWAPLTEGKVSLRDVMSFLFSAGFSGITNTLSPFIRWIFGKPVSFGKQYKARLKLLATLMTLLGLVVINFFIALIGGDRILHQSGPMTFSGAFFDALTSVAGLYVFVTLIFGGMLWWATEHSKSLKPPKNSASWLRVNKVLYVLFVIWVATTPMVAIVMGMLAKEWLPTKCFTISGVGALWLPIWGGLLLASKITRQILIQYMGDVAAYVSSHSLDRFNDIRNRIKAHVFELAKAVYSDPQYEQIAMVGHSLGSVITYDTLNALINHDLLNHNPLKTVERTKLLVTFGSPLDKVAFIFATQPSQTTATREALAATLQPLIQSYHSFRNLKWINIWSPRDIVSGSLEFYDDKDDPSYGKMRVDNIVDNDAKVPLAAHIEYWNNPTLFDQLYANL